jgi:ubiquinone/menaquinone biosynthesis C-methylase UbiE
VTGVEITGEALSLARAEALNRGVHNIDFLVADVPALDVADHTFDVTHAHQVLQHLADPVQAFREMGRGARPGVARTPPTATGGEAWGPIASSSPIWRISSSGTATQTWAG